MDAFRLTVAKEYSWSADKQSSLWCTLNKFPKLNDYTCDANLTPILSFVFTVFLTIFANRSRFLANIVTAICPSYCNDFG